MAKQFNLLLIDDDYTIAEAIRPILPKHWRMNYSRELSPALEQIFFHSAMIDMHLEPHHSPPLGPKVIRQLKSLQPQTEVIGISGDLTVSLMEEALREGASRFIAKPLFTEEVLEALQKIEALWELRWLQSNPQRGVQTWIGHSPASQRVLSTLANLRGEKGPILIQGETGTGKEVVARLLHAQEPDRPWVAVNIASIPENLFDSELFGHIKGSFTGADQNKVGLAEAAQGGDLFLDEIEALGSNQQVKLLRFLESGEIRKVGSTTTQKLNLRVICASNQNLQELVKQGKFREDLYFRISGHRIDLPPLRLRVEDIPELAQSFLSSSRVRSNKSFSEESLKLLMHYSWPGNVRELKRVCEQLSLSAPLPIIRPADIQRMLPVDFKSEAVSLADILAQYEAVIIKEYVSRLQDLDLVAEKLSIGKSTLYKKIKDYNIEI
jgi:DNA-binding NtrC family response regulator